MTSFVEYLAGRGDAPTRRELNRLIERHEWFTTARRARALLTGEPDSALVLPSMFWPTVPPTPVSPQPDIAQTSAITTHGPGPDLIDRFIEHGGYRIVPGGDTPDVEVDIDIDPDMVTPELAEIYRAQGLDAEAEKIDRILRRRNS